MAAVLIRRSTLKALKGTPGKATVTVQGRGTFSFSPTASKVFAGYTVLAITWDDKTRELTMQAFPRAPKGLDEADLFKLGYQKKSKCGYFAGASLLQDAGAKIGYEYQLSGNQTFELTVTPEHNLVSFILPKGSLPRKPRPPRAEQKKYSGMGSSRQPLTENGEQP
jgi:hypothetical protein